MGPDICYDSVRFVNINFSNSVFTHFDSEKIAQHSEKQLLLILIKFYIKLSLESENESHGFICLPFNKNNSRSVQDKKMTSCHFITHYFILFCRLYVVKTKNFFQSTYRQLICQSRGRVTLS